MYYQSPHVIRKGKIPMITSGTASVVARGYNGAYGEYGASWAPKKKRLAQCPAMQDAYDKWLVQKERKIKNCSWPYLGGCAKSYRKKQAKLENEGKAAWQMCKGQGKLTEAQDFAVETGIAPPAVLEQDVYQTADGGTVVVAEDYDYDDNGEEDKGMGGTLLLMGLVGGGALLLLLMLKK